MKLVRVSAKSHRKGVNINHKTLKFLIVYKGEDGMYHQSGKILQDIVPLRMKKVPLDY
jgi:hypothetical protein